ncbi:MAG: response regulator [Bacillota bacterium]
MRQRRRVLVADDQAEIREILEQVLREEGCEVYTARNGHEAVAVASLVAPDLVLLDISMPGPSGWETLPLLQQKAPGAGVVIMTGCDVEAAAARAGALGLGFLAKPFDLEEIRRLAGNGTEESA